MKILFVTSNKDKLYEAANILGNRFTLITPAMLGVEDDIPENGESLEQNAVQKAEYLYNLKGVTCFADDTGLEVEALNGAPGVYSARYAGPQCNSLKNIEKLLFELKGAECRKARFRTIIALIIGGKNYTFEGLLNGTIVKEQVGRGGFGYDPIFLPNGYTKTLAELSLEEKNSISHRGIALRKLLQFLNQQ